MQKRMDTDTYDLTDNLERWSDFDLESFINDTEVMMGLEKYQIVKLAQEVVYRWNE